MPDSDIGWRLLVQIKACGFDKTQSRRIVLIKCPHTFGHVEYIYINIFIVRTTSKVQELVDQSVFSLDLS